MLHFPESLKISWAIWHFWPRGYKHNQYDFQTEAYNHRQMISSLLSLLWESIPVLKSVSKDHCFLDYLSYWIKNMGSRGPLYFHINFKITLSISSYKLEERLSRIHWIILKRTELLAILNLLIHEHLISIDLVL